MYCGLIQARRARHGIQLAKQRKHDGMLQVQHTMRQHYASVVWKRPDDLSPAVIEEAANALQRGLGFTG